MFKKKGGKKGSKEDLEIKSASLVPDLLKTNLEGHKNYPLRRFNWKKEIEEKQLKLNEKKTGSRFWKHLAPEKSLPKFAFLFLIKLQKTKPKNQKTQKRQMNYRKGYREAGCYRGGKKKKKIKKQKSEKNFYHSLIFFSVIDWSFYALRPHSL